MAQAMSNIFHVVGGFDKTVMQDGCNILIWKKW